MRSAEQILAIHRGIVDGLLPAEQSGRWRREPVIVHDPRSGDAIYWPPDHQHVAALMDDLIGFLQTERHRLDALWEALNARGGGGVRFIGARSRV